MKFQLLKIAFLYTGHDTIFAPLICDFNDVTVTPTGEICFSGTDDKKIVIFSCENVNDIESFYVSYIEAKSLIKKEKISRHDLKYNPDLVERIRSFLQEK